MHGSKEGMGADIVEWGKHFLEAYRAALTPTIPKDTRIQVQWSPPELGRVKVNVDVGFILAEKFQVAMVARDSDGACIGGG